MKGTLGAGLVAILLASLPFGTAAGQTPAPSYEPRTDAEKAATAVLTTHCARCHQVGRLQNREKPAKGFGNVLQLDQLAADPSRILPGNPDGSRLFKLVADKNMPFDRYQDGDPTVAPTTEADIAALRDWITSLEVACQPKPKTYASLIDAMMADIGRQPDHRRHGTRYVTLTHLSSNCSTEAEMNIYRQGVIKLLNSLSRNPDVVKLETIDEEKSIIRFNIDDLDWSPGVWDLVGSRYPYGARPANSQFDALAHATGADIPFVRGDWLAFTAARPPLYHEILDLPDRFERLQADQGVDVRADIEKYEVRRAGFQRSGVSRNNRMIERHTIATGAFWTSYDFAGNRERQNLFEFPLGPGGEHGFSHDGGETIFNLPNGFQAYYLNTADGLRLDQGPTNIVQDPGGGISRSPTAFRAWAATRQA
jgi:mono/diheme cytochrome c family protein